MCKAKLKITLMLLDRINMVFGIYYGPVCFVTYKLSSLRDLKTAEDAGNNFYLDKNSIGQSRAKAATELLLELNEDVCGDYIKDNVDNLLATLKATSQNIPSVFCHWFVG